MATVACNAPVGGPTDRATEPSPPSEVPDPAPTVLHRLTQDQLDHTLRDLFDDPGVPSVPLPAEQPIDGFVNQQTRAATPYLVESLVQGMQAVAAYVVADGGPFVPCPDDAAMTCDGDALVGLMERAFRRPVTDDESAWLRQHHTDWTANTGRIAAFEQTVALILLSPDVVYLLEASDGALTDHQVASRLSYLLWDSMPDEALLAAADGGLTDPEAVRAEATRMLDDPRAHEAMGRFARQWLGLAALDVATWDLETFAPTLDPDGYAFYEAWLDEGARVDLAEAEMQWRFTQAGLKATMRDEFDQVVHSVVTGEGTLRALLTTPVGVPTGGLDLLYGAVLSDGLTALAPTERPGVLTRAAVLAAHGHPDAPSPVLRGAFLTERLRCQPPEAAPATVPTLEEATAGTEWTTNRERYEQALTPAACAGCHASFTPVGYVLEAYDAMGRWRSSDGGVPVDTEAAVTGLGTLDGPAALMEALAADRAVHDCVATQFFRYGTRRTEVPADDAALQTLREGFWTAGGALRTLVLDFVTSPAFLTRPAANPDPEAAP